MANSVSAHDLKQQPVSVTRQMSSAFPRLKAMALEKGLKLHHLGAGYPHPEVSDPTEYIRQKNAYFDHLGRQASPDDPAAGLRELLIGAFSYTDTLGPPQTRQAFAEIYGRDFDMTIDPDLLLPTVGATGGISLLCSLFERTGKDIAYIVDAPTYTGFLSRAILYQKAHFYSVDLDDEGPDVQALRDQIRQARQDGHHVAFYYTVPDGHNPGGISFSQKRREEVLAVLREENTFAVEDAPYTYISHVGAEQRPKPFYAIDPDHSVHLFTASKIGLPGPRVGYLFSGTKVELQAGAAPVRLKDLLLTEASGDILFHNPEALRGFEAYLMNEDFQPRESLWPLAALKNAVYGENRAILLDGLREYLGDYPEHFSWTEPGAGFFSVFTFTQKQLRTNAEFIEKLIADHGVVTIPMFGFYPQDAKDRDPEAGLDQIRLSFSFNESIGEARRQDMRDAVRAFANAVRVETSLPAL